MVYAARPDFYFGTAFNAAPNDPSAVPNWTELTPSVKAITPAARGRAYELGLSLPGQPVFTIRDINEYLNAANANSPYLAGLVPYRRTVFMGMYPNGGTGNLLNSGTWRVPRDPTFDSYVAGTLPPWITQIGGVVASIGTTTPRSGLNDLTWAVAGGSTVQGVSYPVDCIPGRQYTASAYVRQTSASTVGINCAGLTAGVDAFLRVVSGGWGNADVGGAWTATGGTVGTDYAVSNGIGTHSLASVNVARMTTLGASGREIDETVQISVPAVATGAALRAGLLARWQAASDFYRASADFNTDGTITLQIWKRVAGVETSLASATVGFSYTAGTFYNLRFQLQGTNLSATMWQLTDIRPSTATVSVVDASLQAAGNVGVWSRAETGNTNSTPVISYDSFNGVYALEGNSTTATGAYNRLAVTFTATQPVHTIIIQTRGTAVAGQVLVDDIQHEPGGAASVFTSTGPVIYPISANLASSWQSYWMDVGFEGNNDVPCIDALTALQGTRIGPEWIAAAIASNPDAWWELKGPGPWSSRANRTGVPKLQAVAARYGGGTGISAQTLIPIPGYNGATGVHFSPDPSNVNSSTSKATIVGTGPVLKKGSPSISWPARNSAGNYVGSAAFWFQGPYEGATVPPVMLSFDVILSGQTTNILDVELNFSDSTGEITYQNNTSAGAFSTQTIAFSQPGLADNLPHFAVVTVTQDATNTSGKLYIDGVLYATSTFSTGTALGGMWATPANTIEVGGIVQPNLSTDIYNGTISQVMLWNRVLSATDVTNLYNGGAGFAGETTGARVARHLALGGYVGPTRISAGRSTMGPPSFSGSIDLLSDFSAQVLAESGAHWVAPDGAYVFEGRDDRYNRLTPSYTFGENTAGGEIPYGDDIRFSVDPLYIFTDVQVTRPNGTTAYGGLVPDVAAAIKQFFTKTLPISVDLADDDQIYQLAGWIFYTHNRSGQRVARLAIDPTGRPSLWPVVLSIEVGQRVTVKRRPSAANAGAGITMSADYFVESVAHVGVDLEQGTWQTVLTLSPIGSAPGMTVQPWIMDNATFSVLGSTTVAGY